MYVNSDNVTYFDCFEVEHIPKEIKKITGNKNIYRIQTYNSIMCRYFCIEFIYSMLKGKSLLDYANLLSRNEYEKIDKVVLKHFKWLETNFFYKIFLLKVIMKKIYCINCRK